MAEVTKYCVKPFDYASDPDSGLAILNALGYTLKGRRFLQKFGVLEKYYKEAAAAVPEVHELSGNEHLEQMFDFALIWDGEKYVVEGG